jgi:hypothetical protein
LKAGSAISLLLIAGCSGAAVHDIATPHAPTFCDKAMPILIGKKDKLTAETANDILAHNRTGEKLCGWKPTQ